MPKASAAFAECLSAEEVVELNDMTEMRSGKKSDMVLLSDYLTVSGTCFINKAARS